jgi:hypothetical protein
MATIGTRFHSRRIEEWLGAIAAEKLAAAATPAADARNKSKHSRISRRDYIVNPRGRLAKKCPANHEPKFITAEMNTKFKHLRQRNVLASCFTIHFASDKIIYKN